MLDAFDLLFGENSDEIVWWQMSIGALTVFFYAVALYRIGPRRAFANLSALAQRRSGDNGGDRRCALANCCGTPVARLEQEESQRLSSTSACEVVCEQPSSLWRASRAKPRPTSFM